MIDITGLSREDVLRALYNRAVPLRMGFHAYKKGNMTEEQATLLLSQDDYFDYVLGRPLKLKLIEGAKNFDEWLYERDQGEGAAAFAISALRLEGPDSLSITEAHNTSMRRKRLTL